MLQVQASHSEELGQLQAVHEALQRRFSAGQKRIATLRAQAEGEGSHADVAAGLQQHVAALQASLDQATKVSEALDKPPIRWAQRA